MMHTPSPWHVDAFGCHNDYRLRLCEPMRSGFPLATIAQFQYNWRDAGQYDRQISYKEGEANARRAAACVNALEGIDIAAIEAGVVKQLVEAIQGLGAMPEGFCFCHENRIGDDSKVHYPECHDLRNALALIAPAQELQEQQP
jgi:hypothetical protein